MTGDKNVLGNEACVGAALYRSGIGQVAYRVCSNSDEGGVVPVVAEGGPGTMLLKSKL